MTDTTDTAAARWLTVAEAAAKYRCGKTVLYDHIRAERIPSIRLGSRQGIRIREDILDDFFAQQP